MTPMFRCRLLVLLALAGSCLSPVKASLPADATTDVPAFADARTGTPRVIVSPRAPSWTLEPGQPAVFDVSITLDAQQLADVPATVRIGPDMFPGEPRDLVIPAGGVAIEAGTMEVPGFLRCEVVATVGGKTVRGLATIGYAPERIQPVQVEPEDFDAFWAEGRRRLDAIPMDLHLDPWPERSDHAVVAWRVSFSNIGGGGQNSRFHGVLMEPRRPGSYAAVLRVPGAGVRPYSGDRELAAAGAITLDVGIHGIPIDMPQAVYDQLRYGALDGYPQFRMDDPERYYYRRVILGCWRALDVLLSRPGVDPTRVAVVGGSQGGFLAAAVAGLDSRVTRVAIAYPAYADVTGFLHGRAGGWPKIFRANADGTIPPPYSEAAVRTTSYYDAVNFARRIRVPGHYLLGYNDEVCPPTSMFALINVVTAPKEVALILEAGHAPPPEGAARVQFWLRRELGL